MEKGARKVAQGKTKTIFQLIGDPEYCWVVSSDKLTAGNGLKKASIPGKANLSTSLTCNIFSALNRHGIKTAGVGQVSLNSFLSKYCRMIPLEVVIRYRADAKGSFLKRHPEIKPETHF